MMTLAHQPSDSTFEPYSDYIPGMSDEEELKRMGRAYAETDGLGEEIYTDVEEAALQDLGFKTE